MKIRKWALGAAAFLLGGPLLGEEKKPGPHEVIKEFLERLSSIQDGEKTLLDSTSVIFGSGIGSGNSHTNSDLPIILAGGGYRHGEFKKVESKGLNNPDCINYIIQRNGFSSVIDQRILE